LLFGIVLLYLALAYGSWRFWVASDGATYLLAFPAIFLIGGLIVGAQVLYVLTRSTPILRLSREGLVDESSLSAAGIVPWADIAALVPSRISFQKFLGVFLKDPESFAARLSPWRRCALRLNLRLGLPPILIAQTALPVSAVELAREINSRFGIPVLSG
jgi:hypothetical protein